MSDGQTFDRAGNCPDRLDGCCDTIGMRAGLGLTLAGLVLLALVHVSTVSLQVPAHRRLASGFDDAVAKRLVRSNWIRTAGWTARGGVAVAMLTVAT